MHVAAYLVNMHICMIRTPNILFGCPDTIWPSPKRFFCVDVSDGAHFVLSYSIYNIIINLIAVCCVSAWTRLIRTHNMVSIDQRIYSLRRKGVIELSYDIALRRMQYYDV